MGAIDNRWVHWSTDLDDSSFILTGVHPDGSPTGFREVFQTSGFQIVRCIQARFIESPTQGTNYFVDDLWVLSDNGTTKFAHEDFSYGDITELTTGSNWDVDIYGSPQFTLTTSSNMGFSRSVLNIEPEVLSAYYRSEAQLEFLNGWYRTTEYSETSDYISGYYEEMAELLGQKYYQHYFTVLDVSGVGYYEITVGDTSQDNKLLYIDGEEVALTNGVAQVYLRTGLHPVYLRVYADGADSINAFTFNIVALEGGGTVQAYTPRSGRMTAIYYDNEHFERIRDIDSLSYYTDPDAMLGKANTMMVADAIGGLKVSLDADDILDYMLRDINSGTYDSSGHSQTPLYDTAGSVIFSCDAIPDTLYMGEYQDSIMEKFLEMSGYVVVDGNLPFTVTTHADGTSTHWELGAEYILDMVTDEAWYHADDAMITYGPKDTEYSGLFSQSMNDRELWADKYTYSFDSNMPWNIYDTRIEHENTGTGLEMFSIDTFGSRNSIWEDKDAEIMLAPGHTKISFIVNTEADARRMRVHLYDLTLTGQLVSSNALVDGLTPMSNMTPLVCEGTPIAENSFLVTFDLGQFVEFYDMFVTQLSYVLSVEAEAFDPFLGYSWKSLISYKVTNIAIDKQFMVRTSDGFASNMEMTLPTAATGKLEELRLSRYIVMSEREQARVLMEQRRDWALNQLPSSAEKPFYWDDEVDVQILTYDNSPLVSASLRTTSSLSNVYATGLTSEDTTLVRVPFKQQGASEVNPLSYRLSFSPTECRSSQMAATGFYWKVMNSSNCYTNSFSSVSSKWMPQVSITVKRDPMQPVATGTGKMLFGELDDYSPMWSLDTSYLSENNRRFLEYSTWAEGHPTEFANPVTFQADEHGGGIVTYGLSQLISRDHAWYNASLSEVYMDYIARSYRMNLWGHTPSIELIQSIDLEYALEDRIELWNQEGWADEAFRGTVRNLQTLWTGRSAVEFLADAFGAEQYSGRLIDHTGAVVETYGQGPVAGNGQLESFVDIMVEDYDGADWYSENQYIPDTTRDSEDWALNWTTLDMTSESLTVRPSLSETSGWDKDSPRFDLVAPGLGWASAPGSILRHQAVRGRNINVQLDWTDANLTAGETVYINAQVEVWGDTLWINQTITVPANNITVLMFDIGHLVNNPKEGKVLWVSDNQTLSTPPSVTLWAYREDPDSLNDIVSVVRNLIYVDRHFLRMDYDDEYIDRYLETIQANENEANAMKKWYIVLGAVMMAAAPLTAGTSAVWGLDMIVSVTTGKSMFDHILHGAMSAMGVDKNYIGNFSIWGITSNQGWNLILTEALAGALSFGIGTAAKTIGRLAGRLGSSLSTRLAGIRFTDLVSLGNKFKSVGSSLMMRFGTTIDDILDLGWTRGFEKLSKMSTKRAIGTIVMKGVGEYFELVGEVIFEMAFDSMLRMDKSERPWGGGELFITAMTLSVIISGLMRAMGKKGIKMVINDDGNPVRMVSRARLLLPMSALALQGSMLVMRIPVLMGNQR